MSRNEITRKFNEMSNEQISQLCTKYNIRTSSFDRRNKKSLVACRNSTLRAIFIQAGNDLQKLEQNVDEILNTIYLR